jgi:hypothetical protein
VKVVTIATDLDNDFLNRLLIPSCRAVGLDLVVLPADPKGFKLRDKRTVLMRYLAGCPAPDELILFTDAYDTLLLRDEQYIQHIYNSFSHRVVFSAESNCFPLGAIGFALQEGPPVGRYPYLNSGGFIGPAGDILALCTKYPKPPSEKFPLLRHIKLHNYDTDELFNRSDQYYWTLVRLLEPETVGLDNDAVLFENFATPLAGLDDPTTMHQEFLAKGKEAVSYQRERARLEARLRTRSDAAQVHFASYLTKNVTLDLFEEGQLPPWLCGFLTK